MKNKFKNLKIMPKKTSKPKKNSLKLKQTFTESKTLRRACTMKTSISLDNSRNTSYLLERRKLSS